MQFFKPEDIRILANIANTTTIHVMCYGLLLDSDAQIFPASRELIASGAELEEMRTVCQTDGCVNHATHHLRYDAKGRIVRNDVQCQVGDSAYKSVCRVCFDRLYYQRKKQK